MNAATLASVKLAGTAGSALQVRYCAGGATISTRVLLLPQALKDSDSARTDAAVIPLVCFTR